VVLANWAAQQTRKNAQRRLALKWGLTRRLYGIGLKKREILELFRLIDWLMQLPKPLEARLRERLYRFEAKSVMPYITSVERHGIKKGIRQGMAEGQLLTLREAILDLMEARFGAVPRALRERVSAETNLEKLRAWLRQVGTCPTLQDIRFA
jgi:hypothetical protein